MKRLLFTVLFCSVTLSSAENIVLLYPIATGIGEEELSSVQNKMQSLVKSSLPANLNIVEESEVTDLTKKIKGCLGNCILRSVRNTRKSIDYVVQNIISVSDKARVYDISIFKIDGSLLSNKKFNSVNEEISVFIKETFVSNGYTYVASVVAPATVESFSEPIIEPVDEPVSEPAVEPIAKSVAEIPPAIDTEAIEAVAEEEYFPPAQTFNSIETKIPAQEEVKLYSIGTIIGTILVTAGVGAVIYGYICDSEASDKYDDEYKEQKGEEARKTWKDIENIQTVRNIMYGVGAGLFVSGLGVAYFF